MCCGKFIKKEVECKKKKPPQKQIQIDKGQEFRAKEVQTVLKDYKITHLYSQNETKASIAERYVQI